MAASCPTPVGSKRKWCYLKSLVYTRAAWWSAYTRSNEDSVYTRSLSRFCLYQVTFKILFILCHFQDSIYTRSLPRFCLYQVVFLYSHQRPWCGERLGSRYTPAERLRRRLHDCLREARLLGDNARWCRLVSPISTTVGGWARRSKAAASCRAASIMTRVSGRWAHGSSRYTTPGLSLIASPASRVGQVIWGLAGRPEKGLVQGCSREGEERPDPELFTLEGLAVKSWLGSGRAGL